MYIEELLQSLLLTIEYPSQPPVIDRDMSSMMGTNRENSARYVEQQCRDMSDLEPRHWHTPPSLGSKSLSASARQFNIKPGLQ